jgi:hypothetical protein
MIRISAWAVFDPRGAVAAERSLAPRIPDLEGMRFGVLDDTSGPTACCARPRPRSPAGAQVALPSCAMKP